MRFSRLEVSWFQGVKSAQVDFGPGLNVLFGPNDLGKSTLAMAIRAALLLQVNSSEADAFIPWQADEKPTVTLDFLDDTGRYWRVRKAFGGPAGAQLWESKDGKEWTTAAKAREVEERLRTLLPWGIPSPGGKTGQRGFPRSFLTQALLGAQSRVEEILDVGLEGDPSDSGRLRLTAALSALAQDPLVKKVLTVAQAEVDRFFTEKGKRRMGAGSELAAAGETVKRLQAERDALTKQLEDAVSTEERAKALLEARAEAAVALERAKEQLAQAKVRAGHLQAQALAEAELAKIDAHGKRVADTAKVLEELQRSAAAKEAAVAAAVAAQEEAAQALRTAEDAVRQASSEEGARQRALELAQLEAKAAKLSEERRRLESLSEKAAAALKAQAELAEASARVTKLAAEAQQLSSELGKVKQEEENAQGEADLAEGIVAYGRWRVADEAAQRAATARSEAAKLRTAALGKDVEGQQHEERAKASSAEAARLQAALPDEAALGELRRLAQDKAIAEAALGGGLSVAVRPRRPIALKATADDATAEDVAGLAAERTFEAERRLQLAIGDLLEVVVTAGAPEQRRRAEGLRRRWKEEALPALERAGAASLADLEAQAAAVGKHAQAAAEARDKAKAARAEAEALRHKAATLEQQPAPTREELEAKEARIGGLSRDVLAQFFGSMGASWEAQAEELKAVKARALAQLKAKAAELQSKRKESEWGLETARKRQAEAAASAAALLESLAGEAPAAAQVRVAAELQANAQAAQQLKSAEQGLGAAAATAQERAKEAAAAAAATLERRKAERAQAEQALVDARSQLHARQGELRTLEAQLQELDRPAAAARAAQAKAAAGSTAASLELAEAAHAKAQAAFREIHEEHLKVDGALTSIAGPLVKERAQQLDEALQIAKLRERQLSVDADAWRLLRDALREAEKTESAHLGKALAVPVASRFAELTKGKYGLLAIDQQLRVESLQVNGTQAAGDAVLGALSVGTRDQLATLVRLAVASQLKSAIVLDDHLVHTDVARLGWFAEVLRKVAQESQVLVFTCRPLDYASADDLPTKEAVRENGLLRTVDLARVLETTTSK